MDDRNIKSGFPQNTEVLVKDYAKLVYSVCWSYQNCGVPIEDLKQEGMIGLLMAYSKFDASKGTQFSTYAMYWIKKQILQALNKESTSTINYTSYHELKPQVETPEAVTKSIKLPPGIPELEAQIIHYSFAEKLTIKEIAQKLQLSNEQIRQLRQKALRRIKSIKAE